MEKTKEELLCILGTLGIKMLSDTDKVNGTSSASNTYIIQDKKGQYVVDPAFGSKRRKDILKGFGKKDPVDILCTHYHSDHSANNGKIAGKNSAIYYHYNIKNKIHYFRTNFTGQIVSMANNLDLDGMLNRLNMLPKWLISLLVLSSKISRLYPSAFMFAVSYINSWVTMGAIYPGRKNAKYLERDTLQKIHLEKMDIDGWHIGDNLIAIDAQGHTDDHLVYYLPDKKALFSGDALNFLNANDIQFGELKKVDETIAFFIEFVEKENVEILLQGHYYPVIGTENIIRYICEIRDKHNEMFDIASSVIQSMEEPIRFDKALKRLYEHPSELSQRLGRITFPRSTLVFLDVYLFKVLQSLGYDKQKNGDWRRS